MLATFQGEPFRESVVRIHVDRDRVKVKSFLLSLSRIAFRLNFVLFLLSVFFWQKQLLPRLDDHSPRLWMVHKLKGELVTRDDPAGRAVIFDRLAKLGLPDTLMPVVRQPCRGLQHTCCVRLCSKHPVF